MASISQKGISFAYGVQTAKGTAVVTTAGFRTRPDALTDFKSGMVPIKQPVKDGRWGDSDIGEAAGIKKPNWSGAPMYCTPALMATLLDPIMDSSVVSTNTVYVLRANGSSPVATKYLTLLRHNSLATGKDKRITDGVTKSIKISSSQENNAVQLDSDFLGSDINMAYTPTTDAYTQPTDAPLLHKGVTFKIGATAIAVAEYDVMMDFGVVSIVDNADKPQEFLLGLLKVSGTVRTPWIDDDVENDFNQSVSNILTFLWGVAGSAGYLEIIVPVKYDEPDEDVDNDIRLRQGMPFHYAETNAQAFSVKLKAV